MLPVKAAVTICYKSDTTQSHEYLLPSIRKPAALTISFKIDLEVVLLFLLITMIMFLFPKAHLNLTCKRCPSPCENGCGAADIPREEVRTAIRLLAVECAS